MQSRSLAMNTEVMLDREGFQQLLDLLREEGYETVGPTVRGRAIVYDALTAASDLPIGWHDVQAPGSYRIEQSGEESLFAYVLGPHSWKKYLHPPEVRLWGAKRDGRGFHIIEESRQIPRFAFVGVRACELRAIGTLDRVFRSESFIDVIYHSMRQDIFVVAVNCTRPGGTCFCVSMNAGPRAESGFDIALTEIPSEGRFVLLAEAGSERGARFLAKTSYGAPSEEQKDLARQEIEAASQNMGRTLDPLRRQGLFLENLEHPRWDIVAGRCLACGNCTLVCPTCFCNNMIEKNDLEGQFAERWRLWDSCFSREFSYIHGGCIRESASSRYRQWLTHKLVNWMDQFGTEGCVGCGRCITWCPVGIDITEEAREIFDKPCAKGEKA